jgi:hypothetical protein
LKRDPATACFFITLRGEDSTNILNCRDYKIAGELKKRLTDAVELVEATSEEAVDASEAAKQFVAEIKKVVSEQ